MTLKDYIAQVKARAALAEIEELIQTQNKGEK